MNPRLNILAVLSLAPILCVVGCGGGINTTAGSDTPATVSMSPKPASLPAGTSITFTAAVSSNALVDASWEFLDLNDIPSATALGTLATPSGNTVVYTAPTTPPIYAVNSGITQGTVTVAATVPNPGKLFSFAADQATFVITAPSVTAGISPTTATVPLGTTLTVYAYAVGSVNNAITMKVAGVAGGSAANGTIILTTGVPYGQYTYTAPATMPMSGSSVTITVVSTADPTKTASLVVTLK